MQSLNQYEEIVVFDTETTGLDAKKNRIIELAACRYALINGQYELQDQIDLFIRRDEALPLEIVNLTGITDQMLEEQGVEEAEVAYEFFHRFIANSPNKKLFAAYNAPFDIAFIDQLLNRHGLAIVNVDYLDILTIYKDRAPYPHKLKDALNFYALNDKVKNSHRAIDDCLACYEVLVTMARKDDDLVRYINLFGHHPKYAPQVRIEGVKYMPQPYDSKVKLYQTL